MTEIDYETLRQVILDRGQSKRSLTALAGPPASGKSHIANALCRDLNKYSPDSAVVLPMDGYHLDDALLEKQGMRDRKGAPHTFDIAGFIHILQRISLGDEIDIAVPVFDRSLELSRAAGRLIPRTARHILVEGNYLLLDQPEWRDLASFFTTTVMITAPRSLLERRLMQRWQNLSPTQAREKCESNDLPNADLVMNSSMSTEFNLITGDL
ncbi:MAG: nucleoside/nucleotide kinase family protein [Paracoccaceae bacterium]|jgi:pantothenate kinase|tara:strand:+ start:149 stop:781 length:633 start_codon:yes stop_codon:yes gene_type:complete